MAIPSNTQVYGKVVQSVPKNILTLKLDKDVGIGYPIPENPYRGYFSRLAGLELLKSNLRQFIKTERGERFMRPDYGCNLRRYLMEPLDDTLFNEVKTEIYESVSKYFSKVSISKLQVLEQGDNGMRVELFCNLRTEEMVKFNTQIEIQ